jgi:hypothetical protein
VGEKDGGENGGVKRERVRLSLVVVRREESWEGKDEGEKGVGGERKVEE